MPSEPRKPNTFLIGAAKCGTSALAGYLGSHPGVFFCNPKEPRYWCRDLLGDMRYNRSSAPVETLEGYQSLFAGAKDEPVIAEGSTLYLRSEVAVPEILAFNPDAKFLVMLRNPVDMFHSWHNYLLTRFVEDERSPQRAWDLQEARARGEHLPDGCDLPVRLQYREMIRLGTQMQRVFDAVPRARVHVILNEDFAADTAGAYRQTLGFLGLPDDGRMEFPRLNAAHEYKSKWLARRLVAPPRWLLGAYGKARKQLPGVLPSGLRTKLLKPLSAEKAKTKLPPDLRQAIAHEMRGEVALLSSLLGRDLSGWNAAA